MSTQTIPRQLMLDGLRRAESKRSAIVSLARSIAFDLARNLHEYRNITIDDVIFHLGMKGYKPESLGNAAGNVFRTGDWECVGWRPSTRVSNHGRPVRVWRLRARS